MTVENFCAQHGVKVHALDPATSTLNTLSNIITHDNNNNKKQKVSPNSIICEPEMNLKYQWKTEVKPERSNRFSLRKQVGIAQDWGSFNAFLFIFVLFKMLFKIAATA